MAENETKAEKPKAKKPKGAPVAPGKGVVVAPAAEVSPEQAARRAKRAETAQRKALLKKMLPGSADHEALVDKPTTETEKAAVRLAQIVNLSIAGYDFAQIGAAIGASEDEVERMVTQNAARYVRSQPALRTYVRNWISERHTKLLDAVWDEATNKAHPLKLEHQDRALRILDRMARLHGAEAPTQAEVKVETSQSAVDALVQRIAAAQGAGYDASIFDTDAEEGVIVGELVHEAALEGPERTAVSGNAVEQAQPGDPDEGEGL